MDLAAVQRPTTRRLLLATTALVGAALLPGGEAWAQCTPTTAPGTGATVSCAGTSTTPVVAVGGSSNVTVSVVPAAQLTTAGTAIVILNTSTVSNQGTITTSAGDGVFVNGPTGNVTNTGSITAGVRGVTVTSTGLGTTITNSGLINGRGGGSDGSGGGVVIVAGGSVINNAGATIRGLTDGIFSAPQAGQTGTVVNNGTVVAESLTAIIFRGGTGTGVLTNTGSVTGPFGIIFDMGGTATNSGTVNASGIGVAVRGAQSVNFTNTGNITASPTNTTFGQGFVVNPGAGPATLNNSGTLSGRIGAQLDGAGSALSNTGNISAGAGSTGPGLQLGGANLTVSNSGPGVITGTTGILGTSAATGTTITNTSTITGTGGNAVSLAGNNNLLTLGTGSDLVGNAVSTGTGNRVSLTGMGSENGNLTGFSQIAMNGTAWTLTGTNVTNGGTANALAVNTGTLTIAGAFTNGGTGGTTIASGAALSVGNGGTAGSVSGPFANSGALIFNRSDTLTVGGAITGTGTVTQAGSGTTVLTGASSLTGGQANAVSVNAGTLQIAGSVNAGAGGTVVGAGATLGVSAGGSLSGATGATLAGAGSSLVNAGSVTGTGGVGTAGVRVEGANATINSTGGTISGFDGIRGTPTATGYNITNAGTINSTGNWNVIGGTGGIVMTSTGSITNRGLISGNGEGIYSSGAGTVVLNEGRISTNLANQGTSIFLDNGGTWTNGATGVLQSTYGPSARAGTFNGTNAGQITGAWGVQYQNTATGTFTNTGTITATGPAPGSGTPQPGAGVATGSQSSAVVNNSGSISGPLGVWFDSPGNTLNNSGGITGTGGSGTAGVLLSGANNAVANTTGGSITGLNGIQVNGAGASIQNAGTVTGTGGDGIGINAANALVTNLGPGSITGATRGIFVQAGSGGSITNGGTIIGQGGGSAGNGGGIVALAQTTVLNNAAGRITSASDGIFVGSGAAGSSVTNNGTINAGLTGVFMGGSGSFTQGGSGLITGNGGAPVPNGVIAGAGTTVIGRNAGTIAAQLLGVEYRDGATGTFTNTGAITATDNTAGASPVGFVTSGTTGSATLINNGTVSATNTAGPAEGVRFGSGGNVLQNTGLVSGTTVGANLLGPNNRVENNAGGTVTGGTGAQATGNGNTITNAGTITGTADGQAAVLLAGNGNTLGNTGTLAGTGAGGLSISATGNNNAVTLGTGTSLTGDAVSTGTGNTISLTGTGQTGVNLTNFASVAMNGSDWTLGGNVTTTGGTPADIAVNTGALTTTGTLAPGNGGGVTVADAAVLNVGAGGTSGTVTSDIVNNGTVNFNRTDTVTYGRTISGTGALNQLGTGTLILTGLSPFTGPTAVRAGTLAVGDAPGSTAALSGTSGATVAAGTTLGGYGRVAGSTVNQGTIAVANALPAFAGNGAGTFTLGGLQNSGLLQVGAPSGAPGNTLNVTGDFTGNGGSTLALNTLLNAGGPLSNQVTDRLLIGGNAGGSTVVRVNATGAGAFTAVDFPTATSGISLIQAGGGAAANSFALAGGFVTGGTPFQYRLFAYGPGSPNGAAAASQSLVGNGGNQWDWRLQSVFVTPAGPVRPSLPGPGPGEGGGGGTGGGGGNGGNFFNSGNGGGNGGGQGGGGQGGGNGGNFFNSAGGNGGGQGGGGQGGGGNGGGGQGGGGNGGNFFNSAGGGGNGGGQGGGGQGGGGNGGGQGGGGQGGGGQGGGGNGGNFFTSARGGGTGGGAGAGTGGDTSGGAGGLGGAGGGAIPADARPALAPQVPAYLSAANALFNAGFQDLDQLHRRLGEIRDDNNRGLRPRVEFFARGYGGSYTYRPNLGFTDFGTRFSQDYAAFQIGASGMVYDDARGSVRLGAALVSGQMWMTPRAVDGPSRANFDTQRVAAIATYQANAGWYVDAILSVGSFSGNVTTPERGRTTKLPGSSFAASVEVGYPIALGWQRLTLEPQAQLIYQRLDFSRRTDVDGIDIGLGRPEQGMLRLGTRLTRPFNTGDDSILTPYAKVNLLQSLGGGDTAQIGGVGFRTGRLGTALQVGGGVTGSLARNVSVYGDVSWQTPLSSGGIQGWSFTGGLRMTLGNMPAAAPARAEVSDLGQARAASGFLN